ncbi:NADH dehydrogenase (ubiquinone) complex I, assembly factor 6 [Holothuria leucospilota]|uniref:NADH dehydrogenase (ubiquinone) complex I, assembly factor 6 n=1 Tax=Holothuria leucospilota TaxID=206669 RepID=A0A9Q1CBK9_HOLLE|nr:NADH dehydrogenase (ubiquinone) complex I, assembly factor 6 [Holothuria leucospilota]
MQVSRRIFIPATSFLPGWWTVARKNSYNPAKNVEYCLNYVQKHDYENYLWMLLLPDVSRSSVVALRAFNIELATIKDNVSRVEIGKMRIQFWKEAVEDIYKGIPPHHPVAEELFEAVQKYNLSKRWLQRVIEERDRTLEDRPFVSLEEVESYAENTASSLLYLTLEILGVKDVHADHAASHIGKSQGLTTIIRAVPYHAARRNVLLPQELLIKHNVTQESIIRQSSEQPVKDVIYEIASQAHSHILKAQSMKKSLPKEALPAFLALAPVESYLRRIQKVHFNVFDPVLLRRDSLLPWTLWWRKFRRTF